ncbi:(deoxy)nucleoside triphosphate pyrophosphohydrolase [Amedibacillus sp. YH-ame10]
MMKTIQVVCGIIKQNGKYLIARRGKGVRENIWEFPGGKVEANESLEEAVQREIKEELEIDVNVIRHVLDIIDEREDMILQVSAFLCEFVSGEIKLHAHHEACFVRANELTAYSFEEADQPILQALIESSY